MNPVPLVKAWTIQITPQFCRVVSSRAWPTTRRSSSRASTASLRSMVGVEDTVSCLTALVSAPPPRPRPRRRPASRARTSRGDARELEDFRVARRQLRQQPGRPLPARDHVPLTVAPTSGTVTLPGYHDSAMSPRTVGPTLFAKAACLAGDATANTSPGLKWVVQLSTC